MSFRQNRRYSSTSEDARVPGLFPAVQRRILTPPAGRRRRGLRTAALIGTGLALAAGGWIGWRSLAGAGRADGPIVLVSIDTLRADHLPLYGYREVRTPALDALAADGIVFERAYAHSPQTLPSHASIFTGLLPFEHGVRDNMGFALGAQPPTLAEQVRARGFAAAGFVSAWVLRRETGVGRGFDLWDDRLPPTSPEVAFGEVQRDGADTLAAAERWLDTMQSPRFFLFLHLYEPHAPYTPPARYRSYQPYDGEIAYSDELVGRLVADLKARGLYDPALIVLLSDHGEGLGDHGEREHGLFLYRETIQVPLVVKLPRQAQRGRRVPTPVQHIDLFPTMLDLLGVPPPAGGRGRVLTPLFAGRPIAEQGLYAEALYPRYHFGWSELYALTEGRYRFIRAPRDELYDIEADPGERHNLAETRGPTRAAMRRALEHLLAGAPVDQPAPVSPEVRERLRALGYIGATAASGPQPGADTLPDPKDHVRVLERYRHALDLVARGDFDAAATAFRAIVAEHPAMADAWSELAGLLVRQGRLEEAVAAYKHLVQVAPHDPTALINVAETLLRLGRTDEALAQATLAAETIPAGETRWRARAHQTVAMIALARGDERAARDEAAAANRIDPTLPLPAFVDGLIHYRANRFAAAVPLFEQALQASRARVMQIPDLRYYLGDALARLERYSDAEPLLLEEVRLFPYNLRARAALAMLYRATGRLAESDREVDRLERLAPGPEGSALAAKLRRMFGTR